MWVTDTGEKDDGVDGGLASAGAVHARLTFRVTGLGQMQLRFGSASARDEVLYAGRTRHEVEGQVVTIGSPQVDPVSAIPEPGAALIFGAGIALVATRMIRRSL